MNNPQPTTTKLEKLELEFRIARVRPGEVVQQPVAWEVTPRAYKFIRDRKTVDAEKLAFETVQLERFDLLEVRVGGVTVRFDFAPDQTGRLRMAELCRASGVGFEKLSHDQRVITGLELTVRNKTAVEATITGWFYVG